MSGGCQGPSGLCLGCINAKSIGKGLVDIILNKYLIFFQWPILGQKRLFDRNFQRGVVGFFSGSMAIFFGSDGQVMDIRKQWGWWWRNFLTGPSYPPTLLMRGWWMMMSVLCVFVCQCFCVWECFVLCTFSLQTLFSHRGNVKYHLSQDRSGSWIS